MPPRKAQPGNPLWISWLEEWAAELDEKGAENPAKSVRNAIRSFKKCPAPYDHPAGAQELHHVGAKTVGYLTKRMTEYCDENGLPMPQPRGQSFEKIAADLEKRRSGLRQPAADQERRRGGGDREREPGTVGGPSGNINTSPPKKKAKNSKLYAPRLKSGPYALFIGLASYGSEAWVTKEQIVARGDPFFKDEGESLLDEDKGKGGPGNYGFSGWSSMSKMLIAREYAEKKGRNPVTYRITREGWKIAHKAIRNARVNEDFEADARAELPDLQSESETEDDEPPKRSQKAATQAVAQAKASSSRLADPVAAIGRMSSGHTALEPHSPEAPFLFSYLDENEHRVSRRDQADLKVDAAGLSLFLIEFRASQVNHVFSKRAIREPVPIFRDVLGSEGRTMSAYLPAKYANDKCPGFDAVASPAQAANSMAGSPAKRPSESQHYEPEPKKKARSERPEGRVPEATTNSSMVKAPPPRRRLRSPSNDIINLDDDENMLARPVVLQPSASQSAPKASTSASQHHSSTDGAVYRRVISTPFSESIQVASSARIPNIHSIDTITMRPGSYTIKLILDTREKPGLSSKKIEKMMYDKNIPWEARALAMGDAIWVAEDRQTGLEVVLDCCLERKRLDDLQMSIKDGRYTEQKIRMQNSGMTRLMYLVEESESVQQKDSFLPSIATVKSQLQVVDGFNFHTVKTVAEVCSYLASLTKTFVDLHKHTTLNILPDSLVRRETYLPLITELRQKRPGTLFFTSYDAYQNLNAKVHTISSNWAKMVVSINRMSTELGERFLERFPSPAHFLRECSEVEEEDARQSASGEAGKRKRGQGTHGESWIMRATVSEEEAKSTVRPIGQKLSTDCWQLFTKDTY